MRLQKAMTIVEMVKTSEQRLCRSKDYVGAKIMVPLDLKLAIILAGLI